MSESLGSRIKNAWIAFSRTDNDENSYTYKDLGYYSSVNPTRPHLSGGSERSIVTAVYNRIALDVASFDISHVRVDKNNKYLLIFL